MYSTPFYTLTLHCFDVISISIYFLAHSLSLVSPAVHSCFREGGGPGGGGGGEGVGGEGGGRGGGSCPEFHCQGQLCCAPAAATAATSLRAV